MSLEQFQMIREIESLKSMIAKENEIVAEEYDRLEQINLIRKKRSESLNLKENQLILLKRESQEIDKEIFETARILTQAKEHVGLLTQPQQIASYEQQIKTMTDKISHLEDQGLEKLSAIETLQNEIAKDQTFLAGSLETQNEILGEVEKVKNDKSKIIANFEMRINNLIEQLEPHYQHVLHELHKKKFSKSSVTYIKQHACSMCGLSINRVEEAEIEHLTRPCLCKGCGRLILPLNIFS